MTDEHLQRQRDPMSKLTQVCSALLCGWRGAKREGASAGRLLASLGSAAGAIYDCRFDVKGVVILSGDEVSEIGMEGFK